VEGAGAGVATNGQQSGSDCWPTHLTAGLLKRSIPYFAK
jgi:hypothetical protein